ncbi:MULTISPECIES: Crp/Fnr family transcriptional regulator [unclassified Corallococcus]|uniref:Crp/Fnr family transcriptional regulator n=1 Tax=unclassified Corallococcus TaxID=2685029 RepID=UPI001A8D7D9F|nr:MULTISPECIES: Crp/Fnr family transcriptional regulator [unclassified Corallococcus]MBN9683663.1 Crp/Fnr family transcriptional regulator [Corallococcus sp. NCSPR001]WAS84826.1 Crp/Fnr family transcriptional regulator [Corallococcus sp. NCRR]
MSYAQLLAEIPMFESLGREDLENMSSLLQPRRFARGEVIFHRGDVGTALFIIRRGQVAIRLSSSEGREITLALLDRGDAFGELSLLDGEMRSTDAMAREESHLLTLQRDDFRRYLETRPQVSLALLANMSRLVRRTTQLVYDSAFLDARSRLVRVLLELAKTQGKQSPEGLVITPKLTQSELANLCGVTRESVNKWLRYYVREGMLSFEGGQIVLLQPERLGQDAE